MRRLVLASLVTILVTSSGCTLWFGGDDSGDDICNALPAAEGAPRSDIAPALLRDPGDLTCDDYGGYYCNPECGPCPEATDLAPIPSYNICGHVCETYGEGECAADPACRVVKWADCVLGQNECFTDFLGCFPVDTQPDATIDCWTADAWSCSRSNACTALHASEQACPDDASCPRPFELCVPEGQDPGECFGAVACDRAPPACPSDTTPGVLNGCYTGACIPLRYCPIRG